MQVIRFFSSCNHHSSSRTYRELAIALMLVATLTLVTTSCGTAEGAGNASQSLAISNNLPGGSVQQPYNAVLSVNGGGSPYQFTIASGAVPPGLTLNPATGSFTGQPTSAGQYSFVVQVTDSPKPDVGKRAFLVAIDGANKTGINVSVAPTSVTLSSGGTQQFTAAVTGTPNTAVKWTASHGSVNANGLYTAPNVQAQTQATVTATSQADSTKSATASVTVNPPGQGQGLQITTLGLPEGAQNEAYEAEFTATGGTQPYNWIVSSGSLPPGLALSTSGALTGTPTSLGTFSFSVKVTDAASHTATGNFNLTVVGGSGYDGPAQLPVATVATSMADTPAPGSVVNVKSGGDFQAALNSAQCGQTIELQAGATFTGPYKVPAKSCDSKHWIIVRTSAPDNSLPAEGQRVTPCYAGVTSLPGRPAYSCPNPTNVLAKVQMISGNVGVLLLADGAKFYRFVGLEVTRPTNAKGTAVLMLSEGAIDHIIVDRSWFHGQAQDETHNGFGTSGGTNIAVIDSYFNDFHCISGTGSCTDSHAISGGMGDLPGGPYLIKNNFLEASGEAVLFGGGEASTTPTDITVIGNHFWKPMEWMKGNVPFVGSLDGHPFIVKNHFELKNAVRVLVDSNLMENVWGGFTQNGHAILLTPKNQHTKSGRNVCPICQVTDVTIRYTRISHAGGGIAMANSMSPGNPPQQALAGARYSIHDVVMDDLSKKYVGGGAGVMIANGWPKNPLNTITINHVTIFPDAGSHLMVIGNDPANQAMYGFVFTNNLVVTGQYPVWNAYGGGNNSCANGVPVTTIETCFTSHTFQTNGLIASPPHFPPSSWPKSNFFAGTPADVHFVNFDNGNGGNYQLLVGSPYKGLGSDGKDLGADIVGLDAALAGVE